MHKIVNGHWDVKQSTDEEAVNVRGGNDNLIDNLIGINSQSPASKHMEQQQGIMIRWWSHLQGGNDSSRPNDCNCDFFVTFVSCLKNWDVRVRCTAYLTFDINKVYFTVKIQWHWYNNR